MFEEEIELPPWLSSLAWQVEELVRLPAAMQRFREMVLSWKTQLDEQRAAVDAWRENRREHFRQMAKLPPDHRLLTPPGPDAVDPPQSGFKWDYAHLDRGVHISAWIPHSLARTEEPTIDRIFPLTDRPLRLNEKYTALAAIHDFACKGVAKISPWPLEDADGDMAALIEIMPYACIVDERLVKWTSGQEGALKRFLGDIQADLDRMATQIRGGRGKSGPRTKEKSPTGGRDAPSRPPAAAEANREYESGVDWQDIRDRLLRLRSQGEPFTSQRQLAQQLECSLATINKALNSCNTLKGWAARSRGQPRTQSLNEIVTDNTPSQREPDPADSLPDDEVDRIFALLLAVAQPEERGWLNALDADKRRELVRLYQEQQNDQHPEDEAPNGNRILGRGP